MTHINIPTFSQQPVQGLSLRFAHAVQSIDDSLLHRVCALLLLVNLQPVLHSLAM